MHPSLPQERAHLKDVMDVCEAFPRGLQQPICRRFAPLISVFCGKMLFDFAEKCRILRLGRWPRRNKKTETLILGENVV